MLTVSAFPLHFLITLRWIAVCGQALTILVVYYGLGFSLPIEKLSIVIFLSLGINAFFSFLSPKSKLIPTHQVAAYLLYDLGQLTTILYLSGGLNNPFTVLLLAPVVVAAGFLPLHKTEFLYAGTVGSICVLAFSPYPLPWQMNGLELPLILKIGVGIALFTAMIFISLYVQRVAAEAKNLTTALNASVEALAREQRLASLGALAAAAAHELGTPLTTITLITQDLLEDVTLPAQRSDLNLIQEQLKRCRHILEELAKNFAGEKTLPYEMLSLPATLQLILSRLPADPTKHVEIKTLTSGEPPFLQLTPELIHGLNNILQNGWQFARSLVTITLSWTPDAIYITIKDDGPGYAESILDRLGEPYVSGRPENQAKYHLGLGLFIAQTLLAKIGGTLYFKNNQGAECHVQFCRSSIAAKEEKDDQYRKP